MPGPDASRARTAAGPAVDQASAASRAIRRAGLGQLVDAVLDAVLAEVAEVGAEGVGLDAVDADLEVGVVHRADDVGPGDVEDLVAALVALEVVEGGVGGLQHGAHGAVGDDDALGQGAAEDSRSGCSYGMESRRCPRATGRAGRRRCPVGWLGAAHAAGGRIR